MTSLSEQMKWQILAEPTSVTNDTETGTHATPVAGTRPDWKSRSSSSSYKNCLEQNHLGTGPTKVQPNYLAGLPLVYRVSEYYQASVNERQNYFWSFFKLLSVIFQN